MLSAGRKTFFGAVILFLASAILIIVALKTGQVSDANFKEYLKFLVWTFVAFCGGNGVEHIAKIFISPTVDKTDDKPAV